MATKSKKNRWALVVDLKGKKDHPEHYCHRCGGRNMLWHTDNETWNSLTKDIKCAGIICPICLAELDKEINGKYGHWILTKENGN